MKTLNAQEIADQVITLIKQNLSSLHTVNIKNYMTIQEASIYTGLGVDKIRDAISSGDLEAYKPLTGPRDRRTGKAILLKRTDIESYIERYKIDVPRF